MGGCCCAKKSNTPDSYFIFLSYSHGPVESFAELFSPAFEKCFIRDLIKVMSKHGRVQFDAKNLYLVGRHQDITLESLKILEALFKVGACVPFFVRKNRIVAVNIFPNEHQRGSFNLNFLVACNVELWQSIDTCLHADQITLRPGPIPALPWGANRPPPPSIPRALSSPPLQSLEQKYRALPEPGASDVELAMALSLSEVEGRQNPPANVNIPQPSAPLKPPSE